MDDLGYPLIPPNYAHLSENMSAAEMRELVYSLNKHRRSCTLTNAEKRQLVEKEIEAHADDSDREIARRCGVSNKFVSNMRNELCTVHTEPLNPGVNNEYCKNSAEPSIESLTEPPLSNSAPVETIDTKPKKKG